MSQKQAAANPNIPPYVPDYGAEPERLLPVELPQAHAAYKIVLPGVAQLPVDALLAVSR